MRSILALIVCCLMAVSLQAQEVNWVTIEEALELQKKNPKKIIMDVYTVWCGPCKMLDAKTFKNKEVAEYINKHYYAVKFNGEGNEVVSFGDKTFDNPGYDPAKAKKRNSMHKFARYLQVRSYPSIIFFDEDQNLLTKLSGFKTPKDLEIYLKMFKNDDHKGMTTQEDWNNYYKSFKNEFTGE